MDFLLTRDLFFFLKRGSLIRILQYFGFYSISEQVESIKHQVSFTCYRYYKIAESTSAEKMEIVIVRSVISPLSVLYQIIRTDVFALKFEMAIYFFS